MPNNRSIAFFTMEIALEPGMPSYSGPLGVLARDTIRAAAALNPWWPSVCSIARATFIKGLMTKVTKTVDSTGSLPILMRNFREANNQE